MAELGQTADPRALVPGVPAAIETDAALLTRHAQRVEQVGQRLRSIDVGDWTGQAGARFDETWAKEPPKWLKVADSIACATAALTSYAAVLRWAQGQAGGAVELWDQASAATDQAAVDYQSAAAADHQNAAAEAATGDQCIAPPFVDPGEQLRQEAREVLNRARERLREAGDQAARAISGGGLGRSMTPPGDGPRMPGALDTLVDALTGSAAVSGSFAANGWNGDGKTEVKGRNSGVESSGPEIDLLDGQLKLGELKAYADVFDASARASLRHGDLTVTGAAAASYGADATASAGLTKDGLEANAELSVGLRAAARESANYGILGAHADVEGLAGAAAGAGLTVAKDEVEVAGEAFAGGKVSGDLGADVGGIGAGMHGAAWAGVGAELRGGYEYKDGKFHLGGHAGAALGIGGAVGFDVTIDPEEIGHTAMAAADAIGHGLDTGLGTGLDTALDTVGHAGDDTVRNIGDAASSLAHHLGL